MIHRLGRLAAAIRRMGPTAKEAVPALVSALKDRDLSVRAAAAYDSDPGAGLSGARFPPRTSRPAEGTASPECHLIFPGAREGQGPRHRRRDPHAEGRGRMGHGRHMTLFRACRKSGYNTEMLYVQILAGPEVVGGGFARIVPP